ncbi:MAG: leucine-rich repeat domain-containing protein, partial [Clostridia bacterium]|nr:leucine-rich repeat domain-containing protein [Clostridia bacterium]
MIFSFKRCISSLLCAAVLAGIVPGTVSAETNVSVSSSFRESGMLNSFWSPSLAPETEKETETEEEDKNDVSFSSSFRESGMLNSFWSPSLAPETEKETETEEEDKNDVSFSSSFRESGMLNSFWSPSLAPETEKEESFIDHVRDVQADGTIYGLYDTDEFHAAYPMAEENYDPDAVSDTVASGQCGDNVWWTLDNDGLLTISGEGDMWDFGEMESDYSWTFYTSEHPWYRFYDTYNIRSVVIEDGVTSIGAFAFTECPTLLSVDMADSVTTIGIQAFAYCSMLTSVEISDTVTSIGVQAFVGCTSLTEIHIPASVDFIDLAAFAMTGIHTLTVAEGNTDYYAEDSVLFSIDGTLLHTYPAGKTDTSYQIPDTTVSINPLAFMYCTSLEEITLPNSLTTIGMQAFGGCTSLTEIHIPASVDFIDFAAFIVTGIHTLTVAEGNTSYCAEDSVLFSADGTVLHTYPSGKTDTTYQIPDTTEIIYPGSFSYNTYLNEVSFPASVVNIGGSAFGECTSLSEITFLGDAPIFGDDTYGTAVFYNVTATVYYPAGNPTWTDDVMQNYGGNITWVAQLPTSGQCGNNVWWTLDNDGVLTISGEGDMWDFGVKNSDNTWSFDPSEHPWYNYYDTYNIRSVVIEDGVTSIGSFAFAECPTLLSVDIADSVTTISAYAFIYCTSLEEILLPDFLTTIGMCAFGGCHALREIYIPASTTMIDVAPFIDTPSLESIVVDAGNPVYFTEDSVLFTDNGTSIHTYPSGKTDT